MKTAGDLRRVMERAWQRRFWRLNFFLLSLSLAGCDTGLAPQSRTAEGGVGTMAVSLTFSNWSLTADSLQNVALVLYKTTPKKLPDDFISFDKFFLVPKENFYQPAFSFSLESAAARYEYVAVAQQFGTNILADWRPVGVYRLSSNGVTGEPLTVEGGKTVEVSIAVDFWKPLAFPSSGMQESAR